MPQQDTNDRQPSAPRVKTPTRPARKLQRKLVVGSASDPLEVEADRMADEVMRVLRRSPSVTAAPALGGGTPSTRIARRGDHAHDHAPEVGLDGGDVSAELSGRIRSASGGRPLGGRTLARMESGFGASFGNVRIHAESALPAELAADAFTTGTDIHFAPGGFAPGTSRMIAPGKPSADPQIDPSGAGDAA